MTAPITSALLDRAQAGGVDELGAAVLGVLGAAVDAGIISLPALLDLVHSCSTADQLGDALVMLATTVDAYGAQMNCYGASYMTFRQWLEWRTTPPAPRRFAVVGGDVWTR